jgi:DNA-binding transcriptional ArsR family regulator
MRRDVFQAIADPNRRAIISLLAEQQKQNVNGLAEKFKISRPAISRHIKILSECGLVVTSQQGRDKYCEMKFEKLNEVSTWVEQYKKFWEEKLDALDNYLATLQAKDNSKKKKG